MGRTITGELQRMHSIKTISLTAALVRTTAITLFGAAATLCLHAQTPAAQPAKPLDLKAMLMAPVNPTKPDDLSYSSSVGVEETASAENFDLRAAGEQPPPRRPYSHRPNYSDRTHNPDGSNKYTFAFGGGFTMPTGSSGKELGISWKFQA